MKRKELFIVNLFKDEHDNSSSLEKSLDLIAKIIMFYKEIFQSKKRYDDCKTLLYSATSISANINEAVYSNSKTDFVLTLHISLKETVKDIIGLRARKKQT